MSPEATTSVDREIAKAQTELAEAMQEKREVGERLLASVDRMCILADIIERITEDIAGYIALRGKMRAAA